MIVEMVLIDGTTIAYLEKNYIYMHIYFNVEVTMGCK